MSCKTSAPTGVTIVCVTLAANLLAGCANGGGDAAPAPATALATTADVQRELGNVGPLMSSAGGGSTGSAAARAPSHPGSMMSMFRLPTRLRAPGAQVIAGPQTAQSNPCGVSGSYTTDNGAKNRGFTFFSTTQAVTWQSVVQNQCTDTQTNGDGSTSTSVSNGMIEEGGSATNYGYSIMGSGSTPVSSTITDRAPTGSVTDTLSLGFLGTMEELAGSTLTDVRTLLTFNAGVSANGQTFSGSFTLGASGAPLRITQTNDPLLTVDGPFSYSTDVPGCPGGAETLSTLQPMPLDSNDNPIGGELKIESGDKWVTIAFNADGSANLSFSNGSTAALSATEVDNALANGGCDTPG